MRYWFTQLLPTMFIFLLSATQAQAGVPQAQLLLSELQAQGKKPALVLIDMQMQFTDQYVEQEAMDVAQDLDQMLEFAAEQGLPVINVVYSSGKLGQDFGIRSILPRLRETRYRTFLKFEQNAFATNRPEFHSDSYSVADDESVIQGNLADTLKQEGISDLLISGCFDRHCVQESAVGAAADFNVHVDRDLNVLLSSQHEYDLDEAREYEQIADEQWADLQQKHPNISVMDRAFSHAEQYCEAAESDASGW